MRIRPYVHEEDFDRVGDFLIETYQPDELPRNWLQPRWEYMHFHPSILELDRSKIGIAEEDGRICGVVHFESNLAEVFLQIRPGYEDLQVKLLDYAEEIDYRGMSRSRGKPVRVVYVNDFDSDFERVVSSRGYEKWEEFAQPSSIYLLDREIPQPELREGFRLQSLADENDYHKINQVLWRGFNHPGDPPEEEVKGRAFVQTSPNFRKNLTIVAIAPNGDYASYCGMYYVPENRMAMLEPLATDPDYRRMGMATAVVLESMRRVQALGAEVCWVGSDLPIYLSLGFECKCRLYPWAKLFEQMD